MCKTCCGRLLSPFGASKLLPNYSREQELNGQQMSLRKQKRQRRKGFQDFRVSPRKGFLCARVSDQFLLPA